MLLRGGIPVVKALEMVSGLLQAHFRPRVHAAAALIREGKTISSAMQLKGSPPLWEAACFGLAKGRGKWVK
jgi:general secretion pathway protein F